MEHRGITIPERMPGSTPVRLPRRLVWGLMRPYIDVMLRELTEANAVLRSDLIATNNRVSFLEDELARVTPS